MPKLLGWNARQQSTECEYDPPDNNDDYNTQRHSLERLGSEDSTIKEEDTEFDACNGQSINRVQRVQ